MQRHAERFLVVGNDVARLGPARRLLGLLHATLGDPATADDELALAATASAAAGSALHTGWCNLHRAQVAREPAGPRWPPPTWPMWRPSRPSMTFLRCVAAPGNCRPAPDAGP